MMKLSQEYAHYHTSTFYPRGTTSRKFSLGSFKKEVMHAHLLGRAAGAQKIIENHQKEPYKTIDELIGDLQLEVVNCLNDFKRSSGAMMPTQTLESAYLNKEIKNETKT